jgi:hypothetical protein
MTIWDFADKHAEQVLYGLLILVLGIVFTTAVWRQK